MTQLTSAITITNVVKWLALVIGVLDLVLEFLQRGDLSIGAIVAVVFAVVMFVVSSLQKQALRAIRASK